MVKLRPLIASSIEGGSVSKDEEPSQHWYDDNHIQQANWSEQRAERREGRHAGKSISTVDVNAIRNLISEATDKASLKQGQTKRNKTKELANQTKASTDTHGRNGRSFEIQYQ